MLHMHGMVREWGKDLVPFSVQVHTALARGRHLFMNVLASSAYATVNGIVGGLANWK